MRYLLIGLLKAYRLLVSPLYGQVCRYHPSCSAYALQAVQTHGAARGSWLAVRRLARCHPWSAGGYDPVPGTESGPVTDESGTTPVPSVTMEDEPEPGRDEPSRPDDDLRAA